MTYRTPEGEETSDLYGAVIVANGHHWNPQWPDPPFPGSEEFEGEQIHVHHYREPDVLEGKRVLVLGIGNSATDIAVESSRIADATFLAMRRSAYIIPKYIRGKPTDEAGSDAVSRLPLAVQRVFFKQALKASSGMPTDYGLPEPDHKLLEAHPTVSSELLPRIGHGDVTVKPNIERFEGDRVRFVDGSRRGDRRRRLLHRLPDHVPLPRGGGGAGRPTTTWSSTGGSCRRTGRASTSSASSSRSGRSCRSPSASRSGSRTCSRARRGCPRAR